jgi:hypothetical protein
VAVVALLAVVGLVYLRSGSTTVTTTAGSGTPGAPPVAAPAVSPPAPIPTAEEPTNVDFAIVSNLTSLEVARRAVVYSYGSRVGELDTDRSTPTSELSVNGVPGECNYQLKIDMLLSDGSEWSFSGSGSVTAYEGARYAVSIDQDSNGDWRATLVPVSGT